MSVSLRVKQSYVLDSLNLFSILTGHTFYTSRHPEEWAWWQERLSPSAREAIDQAQAIYGSHMLGPVLVLLVSAVPGFGDMPLPALLADTQRILTHYQHFPYYEQEIWPQHERMLQTLAPVAVYLEEQGLFEHWRTLHLPKVQADINRLEAFLGTFDFDLGQAMADMHGRGTAGVDGDIRVYVCSYAKPHGIKLCGRQFITQTGLEPRRTLQIAIHEMFHPPYQADALKTELAGLIADPLFQDCWQRKDPTFGYDTELAFLEENVVEAITVLLGERAGVVSDPVGYLVGREGDVYRMAVVLYAAMRRQPKLDPMEPFGVYFQRLVAGLDVGRLTERFQGALAEWQDERGAEFPRGGSTSGRAI